MNVQCEHLVESLCRFVQDCHKKSGIAPVVRILSGLTGCKLEEIDVLYPSGLGTGACKMAGLPSPTGCV